MWIVQQTWRDFDAQAGEPSIDTQIMCECRTKTQAKEQLKSFVKRALLEGYSVLARDQKVDKRFIYLISNEQEILLNIEEIG